MFRRSIRLKTLAGVLIGGTIAFAVACGGDDDPTATSPAQPATNTPPAGETPGTGSPTVGPTTAAPTNTPDTGNGDSVEIPEPGTEAGTAVIAVADVSDENGLNQAQSPEFVHYWGIGESLWLRAADDSERPWIAESYEVENDLSGATITIREGIPFQDHRGDFGTLTAEDVAFSMNNANATTNPESIHGQAGDFAGLWGEWTAVDDTTITFDFVQFDATWKDDFLNQSGQSFSVFSQAAFEENGSDFSRDNIVATGPFQVESWDRDEQMTMVNRYADGGEHYLPELTPQTDRIQFVEIIEPTSRATALRTGAVDAAGLEPKDAIAFINGGFGQTGTGNAVQLGVFFSGNLWETNHAVTGEPLDRPTYNTDLPWIGNPHTTADPDDMEQARLIRRALAMAIDREQVNETLIGGLGNAVHVEYFSINHQNWDPKWEYPYDPQEAARVLTEDIEADYDQGSADTSDSNVGGNAFEISVYAGPELGGGTAVTGEVADAVAGYWAQIGLQTFSLKFSYQTFRPSVVGRTNTHPFLTSCDKGREGNPWHFPKGLVQTSLTRGGFSCSLESPEILDFYQRMATAPDQATAVQAANEYLDYVYHWVLQPGIVAVPDDVYYNPNKIDEWPMGPSATSNMGDLWDLVLN